MTKVNKTSESQKAIPYWENVIEFAKMHKLPFFTLRNRLEAAEVYEVEKKIPETFIKIEKIISSCQTVSQISSALTVVRRFNKMFSSLKTISNIPELVKGLQLYAIRKQGEIILYNYGYNQYNDSSIHPEWNAGLVTDSEGPE
jgi:hypothetical protein